MVDNVNKDKDSGKYNQTYKTMVFDAREHKGNGWYKGLILQFDGVFVIPDDEFEQESTVELLHVTVNYASNGHFMYLQRGQKMSLDV